MYAEEGGYIRHVTVYDTDGDSGSAAFSFQHGYNLAG